jgi:hypothetical protein
LGYAAESISARDTGYLAACPAHAHEVVHVIQNVAVLCTVQSWMALPGEPLCTTEAPSCWGACRALGR